MAAVCKPDGQLLLLEHGRASNDWLNGKLDGGAEKHCAKFGCQWNRPILDIVAEARIPGVPRGSNCTTRHSALRLTGLAE